VVEGKVRSGFLRDGIAEYTKRLTPYLRVRLSEVRRLSLDRKKEGRLYVCMDRRGRAVDSVSFADWLVSSANTGVKEIVFLVGGIYGIPDEILSVADEVFSLSNMTFTHEFAVLILLEQLYRAVKISRKEPYHY